jgi:hypothetical protein
VIGNGVATVVLARSEGAFEMSAAGEGIVTGHERRRGTTPGR